MLIFIKECPKCLKNDKDTVKIERVCRKHTQLRGLLGYRAARNILLLSEYSIFKNFPEWS